jgi:hypothetical protein
MLNDASIDIESPLAELIAEENKTMMMDPSTMDEFTKEWWNLAWMEILQRRREAAAMARPTASRDNAGVGAMVASGGGGGGGTASVDDTASGGHA